MLVGHDDIRLYIPCKQVKVLSPAGASARLSAVNILAVTSEWQDINDLERFVCVFPSDTPGKRSLSE